MRVYEREQSTSMRQSFPEASLGGPWNPMWLRWGSLKSLGDSRVSLWGVLCHAFALPYVCHAFAVRLPCDCHAFAMRLACVCYASWQTGVFLEGPWKYSGVPWRPWGPWGSLRGPRWVPGGVLGVPSGCRWASCAGLLNLLGSPCGPIGRETCETRVKMPKRKKTCLIYRYTPRHKTSARHIAVTHPVSIRWVFVGSCVVVSEIHLKFWPRAHRRKTGLFYFWGFPYVG